MLNISLPWKEPPNDKKPLHIIMAIPPKNRRPNADDKTIAVIFAHLYLLMPYITQNITVSTTSVEIKIKGNILAISSRGKKLPNIIPRIIYIVSFQKIQF